MKYSTLFLCVFLFLVRADDIVTNTFTYKNITVLSHDDWSVTILYSEGGAQLDFAYLNDKDKIKYGYNKDTYQAAKDKYVADGVASRKALEQEKIKTEEKYTQRRTNEVITTPAPV